MSRILFTFAISALFSAILYALAKTVAPLRTDGTYPKPTAAQRRRYYLAGIVTAGVGTVVGLVFYALSPYEIPGADLQLATASNGNILCALFLGLSSAAMAAPAILRRMVDAATYGFYVQKNSRQAFGGDTSMLGAILGNTIFGAAIVLHVMLSNTFVALDREKIWWSDFTELGHREVPWSEVQELRIVELYQPLVGPEKERPYLVWVLTDGQRVETTTGNGISLLIDEITEAARYTSERGVAVRRIRRDK